jgi:hypothetical protein
MAKMTMPCLRFQELMKAIRNPSIALFLSNSVSVADSALRTRHATPPCLRPLSQQRVVYTFLLGIRHHRCDCSPQYPHHTRHLMVLAPGLPRTPPVASPSAKCQFLPSTRRLGSQLRGKGSRRSEGGCVGPASVSTRRRIQPLQSPQPKS